MKPKNKRMFNSVVLISLQLHQDFFTRPYCVNFLAVATEFDVLHQREVSLKAFAAFIGVEVLHQRALHLGAQVECSGGAPLRCRGCLVW